MYIQNRMTRDATCLRLKQHYDVMNKQRFLVTGTRYTHLSLSDTIRVRPLPRVVKSLAELGRLDSVSKYM